jgi:hypothetical protein
MGSRSDRRESMYICNTEQRYAWDEGLGALIAFLVPLFVSEEQGLLIQTSDLISCIWLHYAVLGSLMPEVGIPR